VLIEGNHIHDFKKLADSGDHMDMIQFWTVEGQPSSQNVIIRGNFLDAGTGSPTHSIFMRNGVVDTGQGGEEYFYSNIVIEDNVIYNAHLHGITVGATDGLVISNNTLLYSFHVEGAGTGGLIAPQINLNDESLNVTVELNIAHDDVGGQPSGTIGPNLIVQHEDPDGVNYYGDLFVNALVAAPTLDDLRAVDGGIIELEGWGAEMSRTDTTFEVDPATSSESDVTTTSGSDVTTTSDSDVTTTSESEDTTHLESGPADGIIGTEDILIELWDSKLNAPVARLGEGTVLRLEELDILQSGNATIVVSAVAGGDLDGKFKSIYLNMDDLYENVDNNVPYTLFGDRGSNVLGGLFLEEGEHTLQLEVYSKGSGNGMLLGDFTFEFEVQAGDDLML
jgi:hypothetical protein